MMDNIISDIRNIPIKRTVETSFIYSMSEFGELSDVILSNIGMSTKPDSEDGILGECTDVMICMFDIIQLAYPHLTPSELTEAIQIKFNQKVDKWSSKDYSIKELRND